jgi:SAM-dependent methyltransferase
MHDGGLQSTSKWARSNRQYWDRYAGIYNTLYSDRWSFYENLIVDANIQNSVGGSYDQLILDLGCGTGYGARTTAHLFPGRQYVGLDISGASLSVLIKEVDSALAVHGDMAAPLPFNSSTFTSVIALFTAFSYSSAWTHTIAEISRTLAPGGTIYISTLNYWALRRLVRGKFKAREWYRTRHVPRRSPFTADAVPAQTHRRRIMVRELQRHNFEDIELFPMGVLSGVCESPRLFHLDQMLLRSFGGLAHMIDYCAVKSP